MIASSPLTWPSPSRRPWYDIPEFRDASGSCVVLRLFTKSSLIPVLFSPLELPFIVFLFGVHLSNTPFLFKPHSMRFHFSFVSLLPSVDSSIQILCISVPTGYPCSFLLVLARAAAFFLSFPLVPRSNRHSSPVMFFPPEFPIFPSLNISHLPHARLTMPFPKYLLSPSRMYLLFYAVLGKLLYFFILL